jgi:hypothetical protein
VKEWLISQPGEEVNIEWNSELTIRRRKGKVIPSWLWSLRNIVIFECTTAEAKKAVDKEYSLCFCIIGHHRIESEDSNFIAALASSDPVVFGLVQIVARYSQPDKMQCLKPDRGLRFKIMRSGYHHRFDLITLAGK